MRCPNAGKIQAWYDHELPGGEAAELAAHLKQCPLCAERAGQLAGETAFVKDRLAALDPGEVPFPRPFQPEPAPAVSGSVFGALLRPVRVPALVLLALAMLLALSTAGLFVQQRALRRVEANRPPPAETARTTAIARSTNREHTWSLELDLSNCRLLEKPKTFIVKEIPHD